MSMRRAQRPGGALTLASCRVCARRVLKEVFDSDGSPTATAGLERIAELYAVEKKIRGQPAGDAPGGAVDGVGGAVRRP